MQQEIKTAGDLRMFLAQLLVDIREGKINPTQAQAAAKLAAQINQSLAVEVNTALQLERMGKNHPIAGSMALGHTSQQDAPPPPSQDNESGSGEGRVFKAERELADPKHRLRDDLIECEQCDAMVAPEDVAQCRSRFCSLKARA